VLGKWQYRYWGRVVSGKGNVGKGVLEKAGNKKKWHWKEWCRERVYQKYGV